MADRKNLSTRVDELEERLGRLESDEDRAGDGCDNDNQAGLSYCNQPEVKEREFPSDVSPGRVSLIRVSEKKWVNGTVLHYYFFDQETDGKRVFFNDGTSEWRPWTTTEAEKDVVRNAFKIWKEVGIGLEFEEVSSRHDAEIRIGFMRGDGAWSYLGRDVLDQGANERTMNFGWNLTRHPSEIDTAVHEIGHTLGFPHEHQNPNAGIVWDEEAVYDELAKPPNRWSREKTFWNIIRKIDPDTVQGSNWDADSIMHYPFEAGLIKEPAEYRSGLTPEDGLSARDETQVQFFYPPLDPEYPELKNFQPEFLSIVPGEQKNFSIKPGGTRSYNIRTFGSSDTVMVLFENDNGNLRYMTADDDSGTDYNASFRVRLIKNHEYVLRVRLYSSDASGQTAVMRW